jgi:hypothetical protein
MQSPTEVSEWMNVVVALWTLPVRGCYLIRHICVWCHPLNSHLRSLSSAEIKIRKHRTTGSPGPAGRLGMVAIVSLRLGRYYTILFFALKENCHPIEQHT